MSGEKKSKTNNKPKVISGVDENVVHVPPLTVKKLATKLEEIEKAEGYEAALLGVESLDYTKVTKIATEKGKDNDPNLMPSKYMYLYGCSDDKLGKNLSDFPYELHPEAKETYSVKRLAFFLGLIGYYEGPWDVKPGDEKWDHEEDELDSTATLKGDLFGALCKYIKDAAPALKGKLSGGTHKVVAGESLSIIADMYGIRDWRVLWGLNKSALGENWDLIEVGVELKLPSTDHNTLVEWMVKNRWEEYINPEMGYQYPGKYMSLTFLDEKGEVLDLKEKRKCQVYMTEPRAKKIHSFEIQKGDEIDVLIPDTEKIGIWIDGAGVLYNGRAWPDFSEFLAHKDEYVSRGSSKKTRPIKVEYKRVERTSENSPVEDESNFMDDLRDIGHGVMELYRGAKDLAGDGMQAYRDGKEQYDKAAQAAAQAQAQLDQTKQQAEEVQRQAKAAEEQAKALKNSIPKIGW